MKLTLSSAAATLLALALLAPPVVRAQTEGAQEEASPAASSADDAPAWNRRARRPQPGSIDYRVRLLTAELKLDSKQQDKVRRILEDQRTMTVKAWSDSAVPSAVRVKATQMIGEQTADRIRAILTDKQRELYIKPISPEARPTRTTTPKIEGYIEATQRK